MQQLWAMLSNVSRISHVVDYGSLILTTVTQSPHFEGVGREVLIFEQCISNFASARKHLVFMMIMKGVI